MADQRLPIVDGDDGAWGDILNQYLTKEHYDTGVNNPANGGHKTVTIQPGTAAAGTAPLKFSSGSLLSSPEIGAVEFLNDRLYFTQTTGSTRKVLAAFDDTSGAAGDIYYRDSSGNIVRLAVGSPNQVLTVNGSNLPSWVVSSGGGASSVTTTTINMTAGSDGTILVDATSGQITISLPAAGTVTNQVYNIKKIDSSANKVVVVPNGSEKIDSKATIEIAYQNSAMDIVSNGSYWYII